MAIRGPQGPRPDAPAPREQPQSPTQRLIDFGSAKTPQEAVKLLKEILTLLAAAGFPVAPPSKKGDDAAGNAPQRMQPALKQLQKENGLPQTGQLDKQTLSLLEQLGLLPKNSAAESLDQKTTKAPQTETQFTLGGPRLGAEKGAPRANAEVPAGTSKTRAVETEAAKARVDNNKVDVQVDLKQMLNALKSAGFAGVGRGKEQLQDAVKKLQRVDGLPVTGQLDAKTAAALEKRGVIDPPTAQALKEQDPTYAPPPSSSSAADERGAVKGDDARGAGGPAGDGAGSGVSGGAGRGVSGDDGVGDVKGEDDDAFGNNYAGDDDDDDDDRGEANVDDEEADDGFAHWEVKKLAEQVEDAFAAVVRDDDGKGAATYGWELRLHRPGVYGRKQPAEELLHLVVKNAGPFDPVWQQALDGINVRLARYEPDADPVDTAQLKLALQRARYRTP